MANVAKKAMRKRQNARLRKLLLPKTAVVLLKELKFNVRYTYVTKSQILSQPRFVFHATTRGVTHEGHGVTKALAKSNAAEVALRAVLLQRIKKVPIFETETAGNNAPDHIDDLMDTNDDDLATGSDGIPWRHLASFAIHKMFTDWATLPPTTANDPLKPPVIHQPLKEMPPNDVAKLRDPVMLLCQCRPGIQFRDISPRWDVRFTVEVVVDGISFRGNSSKKKTAKKRAAKCALKAVYKIKYR